MAIELTGKWALVTGASRGVGLRIARGLADLGCHLILHSRSLAATKELADELSGKGVVVKQVAAELAEPEQVEQLIAQVREICGNHLAVLYNNAAIMTPWTDTYQQAVSDYALSMQVNFIAPAKIADAFIPDMLAAGFGRIAMVTSGIADQPELMAYSCSKAALDRYVRDMVSTLAGSNVLMNLADPGWLTTDLGGEQAPNHPDSVLPGILIPALLEQAEGSGHLFAAQFYKNLALK